MVTFPYGGHELPAKDYRFDWDGRQVYEWVDGPPRPYGDMRDERAHELANLPPCEALARIRQGNQRRRFRLRILPSPVDEANIPRAAYDRVMRIWERRSRQVAERLKLGPAYTDHGLSFQTPLGTPVDPSNLRRAWRAIVKRAGVGHVRFHDLRHSHASQLLRHGTHLKVVSERLGQASIAVTADICSHVAPGMQASAAAQLERVLREARGLRLANG